MSVQRVSMSFLNSYDKDSNAVNELCRTCLCKTNDEYVSIKSVLPWSKRDICTAQKMIEQLLSHELSKMQPQPQRICSKCVAKIRAISAFRSQCIETDNILTEFHTQMDKTPSNIEEQSVKEEFILSVSEIFQDEFDDKLLNSWETDLFPFGSNEVDENKQNDVVPTVQPMPATLGRPKKIISVFPTVKKPVAKKRSKKSNHAADVDRYVDQLLQEDITASLQSLEKKFKRNKSAKGISGLCEQCGLSFSNTTDYKKHLRTHEDKDKQIFKFRCKFCSKGFNHKQTYNIHHNSHTREIKFICDMCGKHLATKNSLRIHFRYHLGIKNHACHVCGHRFVTPRELRDHVEKKHAASRAIACTYSDCCETFDSEYRLNLHLRVHETNYAFVCDICGVATVSKFRLGIHKKIHTGEMIRQCHICHKSLAHDNALRRHIKNVHANKNKMESALNAQPPDNLSEITSIAAN